jgi:predicted Zn-dependent protease
MIQFRVPAQRVVAAAVLSLIATGCLSNWILPSTNVDSELGAETAKQIETEIGLSAHPAGTALVSGLGAKLVSALQPASFDYRFAILDQPEPNAFAAPGGFIYVSRGLLALATSEDELGGVIGHEIQHVERRHSVKQMQKDRRLGLLALPGRLVAGIISDDLANLVGAPFELVAAGYSRGQETEADTLGQALCARVGYQPAALAAILDRMERFDSIGAAGVRRATFFDSHPSTPDRVTNLTRNAKDLPLGERAPLVPDRDAFLATLDGLMIGADPRSGIVQDRTVVHAGLGCRVEMPAGWTIRTARDSIAAIAPAQDGVAVRSRPRAPPNSRRNMAFAPTPAARRPSAASPPALW